MSDWWGQRAAGTLGALRLLWRGPETAAASRAAAEAWVQTHGGYGFAEEDDIERKFRAARLCQLAPISTNLIHSCLAEHVPGLPRSC